MYFIKIFIVVGIRLIFGWRLNDLFRSYACRQEGLKLAKFHNKTLPLEA